MSHLIRRLAARTHAVTCLSLVLTACGGGGGSGGGNDGGGLPPSVPPPADAFGGTVTGLAAGSLELADHRNNRLTINANGAFSFPALVGAESYHIRILEKPRNPAQTCVAHNASGTRVDTAVSVSIQCSAGYSIGGTVTGLTGTGLRLSNNEFEFLDVAADGAFAFDQRVIAGSTYDVRVVISPDGPVQTCSVENGLGSVDTSNVVSIEIRCEAKRPRLVFSGLRVLVFDERYQRFRSIMYREPKGSITNVPARSRLHDAPDGDLFVTINSEGDGLRLNPRTGLLSELEYSGEIPSADIAQFPLFGPDPRFAYLLFRPFAGNRGGIRSGFVWNDAKGSYMQDISLIAAVADVATLGTLDIHPSRTFAFVAGHVLRMDPATGTFLGATESAHGSVIREYDDRYLYTAVPTRTYTIDPLNGRLTELQSSTVEEMRSQGRLPGTDIVYFLPDGVLSGTGTPMRVNRSTGAREPTGAAPSLEPSDGTLHPTGRLMYRAAAGTMSVFAVDRATGEFSEIAGSAFPVADGAGAVAVDPTAHFLYFAADNRLDILRLDPDTGAIEARVESPFSMTMAGATIAIPDAQPAEFFSRFAYVTNANDNTVSAFRFDPSGLPQPVGTFGTGGSLPGPVAIDVRTSFLYALNTGDSTIAIFAIDADSGELSAVPGSPFPTIAGAAGLSLAASGTRAIVTSATSGALNYYSIDQATGMLDAITSDVPTELAATAGTAAPGVPDYFLLHRNADALSVVGVGPLNSASATFKTFLVEQSGSARTLATGDSPAALTTDGLGRYLYVANEGSNDVSQYTLGRFDQNTYYTVTPIAANVSAEAQPRAVAVDVADRFLFVANFGSDDISVFGISSVNGALTEISGSPFAACDGPSSLEAVYSGDRLLVLCSGDSTLVSFDIDDDTGALTFVPTGTVATGPMPAGLAVSRHVR